MIETFFTSFALMCLGILVGTIGWILTHFVKKPPGGEINIQQGGLIVKAAFVFAVGGGGLLGLAIVGFFVSAVWWVLSIMNLTPGRLALLSILIGAFPLMLASLGTWIAKISGGHVDANGVRGCYLLGFNFNNLVYTLFMCHWAVIFTGGLAVLGLMVSGIWALIR